MTLVERIITIALCVVATMLTRFLPFLIFSSKKKETPDYIKYLGQALPSAIFAILIVYCLKDISFSSGMFGIPELCGIAVTMALHKIKHQTLLSILGGTFIYMILVQFVFV